MECEALGVEQALLLPRVQNLAGMSGVEALHDMVHLLIQAHIGKTRELVLNVFVRGGVGLDASLEPERWVERHGRVRHLGEPEYTQRDGQDVDALATDTSEGGTFTPGTDRRLR